MKPSEFFFLILPLAALTVILVSIVLYLARRDKTMYDKELEGLKEFLRSGTISKKTFERMRDRLKQEEIFTEESERLQVLLHDKIVDQDTYERLRKILEMAFDERIERLNARI